MSSMSDADCSPGREPRSEAASFFIGGVQTHFVDFQAPGWFSVSAAASKILVHFAAPSTLRKLSSTVCVTLCTVPSLVKNVSLRWGSSDPRTPLATPILGRVGLALSSLTRELALRLWTYVWTFYTAPFFLSLRLLTFYGGKSTVFPLSMQVFKCVNRLLTPTPHHNGLIFLATMHSCLALRRIECLRLRRLWKCI